MGPPGQVAPNSQAALRLCVLEHSRAWEAESFPAASPCGNESPLLCFLAAALQCTHLVQPREVSSLAPTGMLGPSLRSIQAVPRMMPGRMSFRVPACPAEALAGLDGEPRRSRRGSTSPPPLQQAAPGSPQPTSGSVLEMSDWADEVPVDNLSQRLTSLSTESLPLATQSQGSGLMRQSTSLAAQSQGIGLLRQSTSLAVQSLGGQAQPLAIDSAGSLPKQAPLIDEGQDLVPVRNAKGKWTVTRSQQTDRLPRHKSLKHHGRRDSAPGQRMQIVLWPPQQPRRSIWPAMMPEEHAAALSCTAGGINYSPNRLGICIQVPESWGE